MAKLLRNETGSSSRGSLLCTLVFFLGLAITTTLIGYLSLRPGLFEPDRLYHLAFLGEMLTQRVFVLREWAQFPILGWNQFFSDKEFLFHFLLTIPYRFFGETGAAYGAAFFSALLIWAPFLFFRGQRFFALATSVTVIALHHYLLYRFSLLRPHTLAVLLFSLTVLFLVKGRTRAAAFSALLFCLAYHAFYLLLIVATIALACSFNPKGGSLDENSDKLRLGALWIFLGCVVGLVLNPYFPANVRDSMQIFALGLRTTQLQHTLHLNFGDELMPRSFSALLGTWGGVLSALVFALYWARKQSRDRRFLFLAAVSLMLFLGGLKSPRTIEYAGPIWALFLFYAFRNEVLWRKAALLGFIFLTQAHALFSFLHSARISSYGESPDPAAIAELFKVLSPGKNVRIFHDNWSLGPYIVYALPRGEAMDALDPTYLLFANPKLSLLRTELINGHLSKPEQAIQSQFGARYALCEPSPLQVQLLATRGVKVISATGDRRFILFDLGEK